MRQLKTAVLLHGYNANEVNWDYVVWGEPPDKPGRIPTAVAVALEEDADLLLLFGSSIGKDQGGQWQSSGKLMTELMWERFAELPKFTVLHALRETPLEEIRGNVEAVYQLIEEPERPANTLGELQAAVRALSEWDIQKLVCVSSADHVSRIVRDALVVFWGTPLANHLSVRASTTLYTERDGITPPERAAMKNVVVAEPRAPVVPYFQRMFGLGNNLEALAELDTVLKKYGK